MSTVMVYRFKAYDIATDYSRESRRMATREAVERVNGEVIEASGVLVDAADLGREIQGMTDIGYQPPNPLAPGFQRAVTR